MGYWTTAQTLLHLGVRPCDLATSSAIVLQILHDDMYMTWTGWELWPSRSFLSYSDPQSKFLSWISSSLFWTLIPTVQALAGLLLKTIEFLNHFVLLMCMPNSKNPIILEDNVNPDNGRVVFFRLGCAAFEKCDLTPLHTKNMKQRLPKNLPILLD
jgi:hypothetical protein